MFDNLSEVSATLYALSAPTELDPNIRLQEPGVSVSLTCDFLGAICALTILDGKHFAGAPIGSGKTTKAIPGVNELSSDEVLLAPIDPLYPVESFPALDEISGMVRAGFLLDLLRYIVVIPDSEGYERVVARIDVRAKGKDLYEIFREFPRPANLALMIPMAISFLDAVNQFHQQGMLHLDIKPENIVGDPESGKARLIDYMDAVRIGSKHTQLRGTLGSIAPEIYDPASYCDAASDHSAEIVPFYTVYGDVFACAWVLVEMFFPKMFNQIHQALSRYQGMSSEVSASFASCIRPEESFGLYDDESSPLFSKSRMRAMSELIHAMINRDSPTQRPLMPVVMDRFCAIFSPGPMSSPIKLIAAECSDSELGVIAGAGGPSPLGALVFSPIAMRGSPMSVVSKAKAHSL
jgi:hypothetical protein